MTKKEFETFLEQKVRSTTETSPIDWEAKKRDWLKQLDGFYLLVGTWLADYKDSGKLKVEMSTVSLSEEHIGTYEAASMTISLGTDKVTLVPVGTLIIGGRGRVDMTGPAGTAKFILTGKHSKGVGISVTITERPQPAQQALPQDGAAEELVWKLATPPPKIRLINLEAETFFSALTEVVNG
jgi:hypothetical protein